MPFVNALRLSPTSRLPNRKLGYSQHSLLDLRTGQAVDQPFGAVGLEVAADFVELLAGIPHHFAGAAHVGKLRSQLQPPAAKACCVLSHDRLPFGFDGCLSNAIKTRSKAAPALRSAPGSSVAYCQVITISGQTFRSRSKPRTARHKRERSGFISPWLARHSSRACAISERS